MFPLPWETSSGGLQGPVPSGPSFPLQACCLTLPLAFSHIELCLVLWMCQALCVFEEAPRDVLFPTLPPANSCSSLRANLRWHFLQEAFRSVSYLTLLPLILLFSKYAVLHLLLWFPSPLDAGSVRAGTVSFSFIFISLKHVHQVNCETQGYSLKNAIGRWLFYFCLSFYLLWLIFFCKEPALPVL